MAYTAQFFCMDSLNEFLQTPHRLRVSDDFADRLMQRIQAEGIVPGVAEKPLYRNLGMAALLLICVSIGILIGTKSQANFRHPRADKYLKEFRDVHHLSPVREVVAFPLQF